MIFINNLSKINLLCMSLFFLYACQNPTGKSTVQLTEEVEYLKLDKSFLEITTLASGLKVPWGMDYYGNKLLFTEIDGLVKELNLETGQLKTLLTLKDVYTRTTPGLLDITIQKNYKNEPFVFINYTKEVDARIVSSLMRYTYNGDSLVNPQEILTIPGAKGHNGSRLLIDKNDILYWATGDVADNKMAQDSTTLNGKVLRMHLDGTVPADNPIPNSLVFAWGFRNIQGMTLDNQNNLFTSEHGDAVEDEVNWVRPLHNYGWPLIEGMHDTPEELALVGQKSMTEPIQSWTPVIAPAGLAFYGHAAIPEWKNSLLLVSLKNQSLRVLKLDKDQHSIQSEKLFFAGKYGRMRAVTVLPNGDILLATSNRDWNPQPGFPLAEDDRIIRLRISNKKPKKYIQSDDQVQSDTKQIEGALLYKNYCASCHQANGTGLAKTFPALVNSPTIKNLPLFSKLLLEGTQEKKAIAGVRYEQNMASYAFLKDEELAAIINYVSQEFGDKSQIKPTDLKKLRK